jgi:LysR family transcriptional regulator, carnitine catabolism transcriptional activator
MKLSIRQLSAVRELARTHSFTEAAARLHTTQSNLSLAIREVESLLGTRLFERTTKRFSLTGAGVDFVPIVERVLDDLQAGVDNVRASARLQKGVLAIGATPLLMATLLAGLIADYRRSHPNIDIRVEDTSTAELTRLLRSRSIEFALGTFPPKETDLAVVPLFDDPLIALAHRSLAMPARCTWKDVAARRLISIVRSSSVGQLVDSTIWKVTGRPYRPMIEAHYWSTVVSLTSSLGGICIVPRYARHVEYGRDLKVVNVGEPQVVRTISVAYMRGRELSPAGQAFLALLRGHRAFNGAKRQRDGAESRQRSATGASGTRRSGR